MCTFISPAKMIGASLALSADGKITERKLSEIEAHIYSKAPEYTVTFSRESMNFALSANEDVFFESNDGFCLVNGEESRRTARDCFLNTLDKGFRKLLEECF